MLKDVADFYENKHVNSDLLAVNFTEYSDDHFHQLLLEANKQLLENYYNHKASEAEETLMKLYCDHDPSFRGFRKV